jgi:hypothetical protein
MKQSPRTLCGKSYLTAASCCASSWRQSSMRKIASRKHYVLDGIRDDNRLEMHPLGDALSMAVWRSETQLHQVSVMKGIEEVARRQTVGFWELSDRHGDLIAGVATGTEHAVLSHLVL